MTLSRNKLSQKKVKKSPTADSGKVDTKKSTRKGSKSTKEKNEDGPAGPDSGKAADTNKSTPKGSKSTVEKIEVAEEEKDEPPSSAESLMALVNDENTSLKQFGKGLARFNEPYSQLEPVSFELLSKFIQHKNMASSLPKKFSQKNRDVHFEVPSHVRSIARDTLTRDQVRTLIQAEAENIRLFGRVYWKKVEETATTAEEYMAIIRASTPPELEALDGFSRKNRVFFAFLQGLMAKDETSKNQLISLAKEVNHLGLNSGIYNALLLSDDTATASEFKESLGPDWADKIRKWER